MNKLDIKPLMCALTLLFLSACAGNTYGITSKTLFQKSGETLIITQSPGGSISEHLNATVQMRKDIKTLIIDGKCESACFLMVDILYRAGVDVAITKYGSLGFHQMWKKEQDGTITWSNNPERWSKGIQQWAIEKSAWNPWMTYMSREDMKKAYPNMKIVDFWYEVKKGH